MLPEPRVPGLHKKHNRETSFHTCPEDAIDDAHRLIVLRLYLPLFALPLLRVYSNLPYHSQNNRVETVPAGTRGKTIKKQFAAESLKL